MKKYLLTIEFRYSDAPENNFNSTSKSKTITIGVFEDFEQACKKGNEKLEFFESVFKLHVFPDGREAKKERFSNNDGALGYPKKLITNLAYLKTPFCFYAKIETLKFDSIPEVISEVIEATSRYKKYKESELLKVK